MIALTLRLEDDVHEALRREAFDRHVPLNQIIRERIAAGTEPQGEPRLLTGDEFEALLGQGEPSDAPELPDDCECEDREALVRAEGLVCGTCDKVIAPAGAGGVR